MDCIAGIPTFILLLLTDKVIMHATIQRHDGQMQLALMALKAKGFFLLLKMKSKKKAFLMQRGTFRVKKKNI